MQVVTAEAGVDLTGATLIAGMMEGLEAAPGSEETLGQVDQTLLNVAGFEGKSGQLTALPHPGADALVVVGLGEEASFRSLRTASANAVRRVKTARAVSLLAATGIDEADRAVAEGSLLGGYRFDSYKTNNNDNQIQVETVQIVAADPETLEAAAAVCQATNLARDWVNTPARDKSPQSLAGMMAKEAEKAGVEVEVWDKRRITQEKLGGVLGVAAGSDRHPRLVMLRYRPSPSRGHLALVGKGITFDTGGISIKPADQMDQMKFDMCGAAAVVASMRFAAERKLPLKVVGIVAALGVTRLLSSFLYEISVHDGVTFAAVDEMLKRAFVQEANALQPGAPAHGTVSRISTATGINRREVARLTRSRSPARPAKPPLATQLFARWTTDPAYRDHDGAPSVLKRLDKLGSYGVVPGTVVTVRQKRPSFVLEVGGTTLALEESVAREIFVRREYFKLSPRLTLLKGVVYDRIPLRAISNALQRDGIKYRTAVLAFGQPGAPQFPGILPGFPPGLVTAITTIDPRIENSNSCQASLEIDDRDDRVVGPVVAPVVVHDLVAPVRAQVAHPADHRHAVRVRLDRGVRAEASSQQRR